MARLPSEGHLERGIPTIAQEPEHQPEAEGSVPLLVNQRPDDGMGLVHNGLAGSAFRREGDAQERPIEVDVPFLQLRVDSQVESLMSGDGDWRRPGAGNGPLRDLADRDADSVRSMVV